MIWTSDDYSARRSLNALEARIRSALDRALNPERLPEEPEDWRPPETPEHRKRRTEYMRQHDEAQRARRELLKTRPSPASTSNND